MLNTSYGEEKESKTIKSEWCSPLMAVVNNTPTSYIEVDKVPGGGGGSTDFSS
jgi:hypothetical protein